MLRLKPAKSLHHSLPSPLPSPVLHRSLFQSLPLSCSDLLSRHTPANKQGVNEFLVEWELIPNILDTKVPSRWNCLFKTSVALKRNSTTFKRCVQFFFFFFFLYNYLLLLHFIVFLTRIYIYITIKNHVRFFPLPFIYLFTGMNKETSMKSKTLRPRFRLKIRSINMHAQLVGDLPKRTISIK